MSSCIVRTDVSRCAFSMVSWACPWVKTTSLPFALASLALLALSSHCCTTIRWTVISLVDMMVGVFVVNVLVVVGSDVTVLLLFKVTRWLANTITY
jgi:hypothetical protein